MSFFRGDASEIYDLARDMSDVTAKMVPGLRTAMAQVGKGVTEDWRKNAVETSGEHGKHYPNSIDSELVFDASGVSVDVGPNAAKKQGSMGAGFEFGSVNQPPHLDGLRAVDGAHDRIESYIDYAVGRLLP